MSMSELAKWSAFILLIIGTLGLVANEFILDWGTIATLTFAALNVVGLIILAYANWDQ
jgi:membrane-bound ClpP family serine protease